MSTFIGLQFPLVSFPFDTKCNFESAVLTQNFDFCNRYNYSRFVSTHAIVSNAVPKKSYQKENTKTHEKFKLIYTINLQKKKQRRLPANIGKLNCSNRYIPPPRLTPITQYSYSD